MNTTTPSAPRRRVTVGDRVELARYSVPAGTRVLRGQRIDGVVCITDHPAVAGGRCYLVERELEQEGRGAYAALQALIVDYLEQARLLDAVPMASSSVRHDVHLQGLS